MKIVNSVLLLLLGVVSAVDSEGTPDQQVALYAPLENEHELVGDIQDSGLTELDNQFEDVQDEPEVLNQPLDVSDEYEVDKANRLSCPFSGKACRFKKAKCVCTSRDSTIKFSIKKFQVLNDSQEDGPNDEEPLVSYPETDEGQVYPVQSNEAPEAPPYPVETQPVPMIEYPYSHEPSTNEIINEVPAVMEGFKAVEGMQDPRQVFMNMPGDQNEHGHDGFEDKTVRIRTEDDNDKKVHEYEYLRIKNVDENGVEEKHIETPENETPEFSYHKGVIPDIDHSLKNNLLSHLSTAHPNVVPNGFPVGNQVAVPNTFVQPEAAYDPEKEVLQDRLEKKILAAKKIQMKLDEVKKRNEELMNQGSARPPVALGYYNNTTVVPVAPAVVPAPLTASDKVQMRLEEVRRRNENLMKQGSGRAPIPLGFYNTPNTAPAPVVAGSVAIPLPYPNFPPPPTNVVPAPVVPGSVAIPLPYPNFPAPTTSGALVAQTTDVPSQGARLRSLKKSKKGKKAKKNKRKNNKVKKSKGEKNEEKMRRKMEKKRRREEKKKAKLAKKNAEKRDRERLEEMKERERIIEEKLENEKEELEESQLNASEKARLAKRLQRQQDLQRRRIDQTERNIQLKRQQQKRLEEKMRVQRIRREQQLLKQQERELDDLSGVDRRSQRSQAYGSDDDDDEDDY